MGKNGLKWKTISPIKALMEVLHEEDAEIFGYKAVLFEDSIESALTNDQMVMNDPRPN